jgi:AraC-like DNA-binding protein
VKGDHDPASNCQKYKVLFKVSSQAEISLPILLAPAIRKIKTCNFEYYKHRFSSLYRQWIGKTEYYQLMCASILLEMLVSFNREMDTGNSSIRKLHLVEAVKDYIQRHMDQPVSLEQLSKITNESPHYIIRAFRELTGQTPVQYLHYIRICSADELLLHSDMKLTEIALYLGYCDQAHFSRTYKRISGRTPLQTITLHHPSTS